EADYNYSPKKAEQVLADQEELETAMLAESEGSTLNNPYVNVDPYNRSPLSALVIFDTEEPAKVTFTVKGKDDKADITETNKEYRSHHELPVLGLYPGYTNTIEISAETESGEVLEHTFTVTTEELPEEMPAIDIKEAQPEKMKRRESELTFYIPKTSYAFAIDVNADVRRNGSVIHSQTRQDLNNGTQLYLGKDHNAVSISERAAESEAEGIESTLIHHDVAELPSGNLLLTVNDGSGVYMEDTMIEMDRETGEVVKVMDLKDLFPDEVYEEY